MEYAWAIVQRNPNDCLGGLFYEYRTPINIHITWVGPTLRKGTLQQLKPPIELTVRAAIQHATTDDTPVTICNSVSPYDVLAKQNVFSILCKGLRQVTLGIVALITFKHGIGGNEDEFASCTAIDDNRKMFAKYGWVSWFSPRVARNLSGKDDDIVVLEAKRATIRF